MTISTLRARLVAAAGMTVLLGGTACGSAGQAISTHSTGSTHSVVSQSGATGAATTAFSFGGISLVIPADWHSTTSVNSADGTPDLTTASSPVVPGDSGLGSASQANLGSNDVLISISEYLAPHDPAGFQQLTNPLQINRTELHQYQSSPPAMAIQADKMSGRYLQIGVAFGTANPTDAQIALANQVLSTLTVAPAPSG